MNIIDNLKKKLSERKKIILPETMDDRVLKAAQYLIENDKIDIILIGNKEEIINKYPSLSKVTIIDPKTSDYTNEYINKLVELRKNKGMTKDQATKLILEDYMYFSCMHLYFNRADGIVSGACHSSANTLRPALEIIKTSPNTDLVSSFFLIEVNNCNYGSNGLFIFADCGLIQNPTSKELALIAKTSADSFKELVGEQPKVAFLSYSTKSSASHPDIDKVIEATHIANQNYPQYDMDGELQLDAAIIPEIGKMKSPNSKVAGHANVLIFPNLDSGNIGYKLVERLAGANSYGPLTQGIAKPVNDLSRGCTVSDIIGVVIITAVQAQNN